MSVETYGHSVWMGVSAPKKTGFVVTSNPTIPWSVRTSVESYETLAMRRIRLLRQYPDYITAIDVARMLGISATGAKRHKHHIKHIEVEGITLYHRASATHFASKFSKSDTISRLCVKGVDVERLQKMCEGYYRTHLDHGPPEILALAKRLAKL